MQKVVLTGEEDEETRIMYISPNETVNDILIHCSYNPDRKIVYLNGEILSREKMTQPIRRTGCIFMSVQNKTVMRAKPAS